MHRLAEHQHFRLWSVIVSLSIPVVGSVRDKAESDRVELSGVSRDAQVFEFGDSLIVFLIALQVI